MHGRREIQKWGKIDLIADTLQCPAFIFVILKILTLNLISLGISEIQAFKFTEVLKNLQILLNLLNKMTHFISIFHSCGPPGGVKGGIRVIK